MASKTVATVALLISLNLIFFTMVSSTNCPPPPPKKPHNPTKPHPSPAPSKGTCPRDALKLNVCADLLNGLVHIALPEKSKCCTLLNGLVDLDAAVCLCTAIKANVLGINLKLPIDLSLVLNPCGKKLPESFKCA